MEDEVEQRMILNLLKDTVRLLEEGKPVPINFLKGQIEDIDKRLSKRPDTPRVSSNPPPPSRW